MENVQSPFEGKLVILRYIECDYEGEGDACLLYRVVNQKLKPLYGVLDLPDGTDWNYRYEQYEAVLAILKNLKVTEVYTPN